MFIYTHVHTGVCVCVRVCTWKECCPNGEAVDLCLGGTSFESWLGHSLASLICYDFPAALAFWQMPGSCLELGCNLFIPCSFHSSNHSAQCDPNPWKQRVNGKAIPDHVIKVYRESTGIAPLGLSLCDRRRWAVIITLRPLHPREEQRY